MMSKTYNDVNNNQLDQTDDQLSASKLDMTQDEILPQSSVRAH